jgi:dTDP-4-amino-4,6-dideoxygalactose transaminase
MFYSHHRAAPSPEAFRQIRLETPNVSGRMDNLRAAILRPQIARLAERRASWNARYNAVERELSGVAGLRLVQRGTREGFVGSSFQFLMPDSAPETIRRLVSACGARGVALKWFGAPEPVGYTSRHDSWRYAPPQKLPRTDRILAGLLDFRLPLTFSLEDCHLIGRIIRQEVARLGQEPAQA